MAIVTTVLDAIVAASPGADVDATFFAELKNNLAFLFRRASLTLRAGSYAMDGNYQIVKATGASTITLPSAVSFFGETFYIDNAHSSSITVDTVSSQTIQGNLTETVLTDTVLSVYSDGTNWRKL